MFGQQENAFIELKKRLVNAPILAYPIEGGKFKLYTDASDVALGGVLSQVQNNEEKVIVYASRKLTNPESRYTVTEREYLAIVHFTKLFRHYLYGDNFEVVTDHSALKWLDEFKDLNSRLLRWSLKLQEFRPYMTVTHRPGKAHANADVLSRPPIADSETVIIQTADINTVNVMEDTKVNVNLLDDDCDFENFTNSVSTPVVDVFAVIEKNDVIKNIDNVEIDEKNVEINKFKDKIIDAQSQDELINCVYNFITTGTLPDDKNVANTIVKLSQFEDDIVYTIWAPSRKDIRSEIRQQLWLPKSLVPDILREHHDGPLAAHLGFKKTYTRIKERFYWETMYKDIRHYIKTCPDCQRRKMPKTKPLGAMQPIPLIAPWERVGLDLVGPLPVTDNGNKFMAVFMDYFTKWPEVVPIPDAKAETVARAYLYHVICRHGAPKRLLTDLGKNFTSELFKHLNDRLGTKKEFTTAYHPQTDGLVERFNRTLLDMLTMYCAANQEKWDEYLPLVLFAYSTSEHASTLETPFMLTYGREAYFPSDINCLCLCGGEELDEGITRSKLN